jgi:spore maturation protein CgeB
VATYTDSNSLRTAVDRALDDPVAARRRAEEGRALVLAHHTFERRAAELVDLMARHGLVEVRG